MMRSDVSIYRTRGKVKAERCLSPCPSVHGPVPHQSQMSQKSCTVHMIVTSIGHFDTGRLPMWEISV